jgi:O-antigen/teichoic acid export membrane protein
MTALDAPDTGLRVVRGGVARAVGYGLSLVLGAAASVFLLRHLGVVEFGRYALVMSLVGIVAGVTDAGLTAITTRELAVRDDPRERRDVVANLVGLRIAITPIGVALVAGFAALAGYPQEVLAGTLIAGAGLLLINAQASLSVPLAVELRNVRLTFVDVTKQAIGTAGIAALAIAGASLLPFFAVQILIGVLILALTPLVVGRGYLMLPRFHRTVWRRLVVEALPLAAAFVLGHLYFRVLMVIVSLLGTDRETGYFAASFRVFEFLATIPILLAGVGLPVIAAAAIRDPVRFEYVLRRMTEVGLLCGVFLAMMVAILAEPALVILGGEQYRPAAPVLRLQALALVGIFLSQVGFAALVALRAQREVALVTAVGIVLVLALGLALVPPYGAEGGAVAVAVGDAALAALVLWLVRRRVKRSALTAGFSARVAVATALALVPVLVPGIPDIAAAALSAAIFTGAVLLLRAVPSEVLDAVRRRS